MAIAIRGGRIIDPANGVDGVHDLFVAHGRIVGLDAPPSGQSVNEEIDAAGKLVLPGLVDACARVREPGHEHKATIASESRAAVAGGITTLCCPPDTEPVIDTPAVVQLMHQRALQAGMTRVVTLGALTHGLEGEHLSEMAALKDAGCVGVATALKPVANTAQMRRALEYAATFELPVFLYAQDPWLADGGCAHEGRVATRLGLPGIPAAAETVAVARDLALVEQTGVRAHFCRLSTARAVRMVARARFDGVPVSADVSAHHLHLTEDDLAGFNAHCHMLPPLRTAADRDGLRSGVAEAIVQAVCSDHQPHEPDAKLAPFCDTEPGVSGLETLLPLTLRLVDEGALTLGQAVTRLTCGPAEVLGLDAGTLSIDANADICIVDPERRWTVTAETLNSRGHNTPYLGAEMTGRVTHTLVGGRVVYAESEAEGQREKRKDKG